MSSIILADNRFLDGVPTATSTGAGYDPANIRDLRTYTHWKAAGVSSPQYLTVDCGSTKGADAVALCKHNLQTIGATLAVESSPTGQVGSWTSRQSAFAVATDKAFMKQFTTAQDRFWRLVISGSFSAAPSIAVALLGVRIVFPRAPDSPVSPFMVRAEIDSSRSKTGQLIGVTSRFKSRTGTYRWGYLPKSFVENQLWPWYVDYAADLNPFFWMFHGTLYPDDVSFVRLPERYRWDPELGFDEYEYFTLDVEGIQE